MKFKIGDKVVKSGGDYYFIGEIVASFNKLSGPERYVVENKDGVLYIFSEKQIGRY